MEGLEKPTLPASAVPPSCLVPFQEKKAKYEKPHNHNVVKLFTAFL